MIRHAVQWPLLQNRFRRGSQQGKGKRRNAAVNETNKHLGQGRRVAPGRALITLVRKGFAVGGQRSVHAPLPVKW